MIISLSLLLTCTSICTTFFYRRFYLQWPFLQILILPVCVFHGGSKRSGTRTEHNVRGWQYCLQCFLQHFFPRTSMSSPPLWSPSSQRLPLTIAHCLSEEQRVFYTEFTARTFIYQWQGLELNTRSWWRSRSLLPLFLCVSWKVTAITPRRTKLCRATLFK